MLPDRFLIAKERPQHAAVLIKKSTNPHGNLGRTTPFGYLPAATDFGLICPTIASISEMTRSGTAFWIM